MVCHGSTATSVALLEVQDHDIEWHFAEVQQCEGQNFVMQGLQDVKHVRRVSSVPEVHVVG